MKHLSRSEIEDLITMVGSESHVATAAWSLGTTSQNVRATPNDWVKGRAVPSEDQMERLVELSKAMNAAFKKLGRTRAQRWLIDVDKIVGRTPLYLIRHACYDQAKASLERM